MPNPVIEFQDVSKTYRRRFSEERTDALTSVTFEAHAGEVCAFLGPNGAGKTTSIGILMGFLFADSGTVRVLGCEPGDTRAKRQIGFLPENFAFYKYLTGPELLRMHVALAGLNGSAAAGLIPELLAKVGLAGHESQRIGKYSRGMVQRLGLAQAILAGPQLLVLDEPTSGLDPAGRKDVLDLLASLKAEGKTVFLSSHILPEVEQICDRVVILDRGRLLQTGALGQMLVSGDRVEIVAQPLPVSPELEAALTARGATIDPGPHGLRILAAASEKRAIVEALWTNGCDVISLNPVKNSLERLFLETVAHRGGTP